MAAPDRIRLTGSLRRRPRKGPLLFLGRLADSWPVAGHESAHSGSAEDPGLARLRPAVLDPDELAEAPAVHELEGLPIPGPVRVVEEQIAAGPHLLQCRFEHVVARHRPG